MRIAVALTICVATSLLGCAGADGQQLPADAVLVGYWSFEEGEGQWTADGSDFAQDAFLGLKMEEDAADPQWVTEGKQGACLRFDGETDRVTVQDAAPLHLGRGVIVEAWVKQTERSHYARVLDKGTTLDLYVHETGWVSFRTRGAEAHGVHSPEPMPLNEWVKIRGEIDGASMRLFVNDELVSERDYHEPMVDAAVDLVIGNARQGRPFCGLIDEVKIWNLGYVPPAALRAHEPDEQTVGLWHLDSAETPDSSAQHNHGELLNGEVVRGRIGQAIKFSGDGCVRVADHPSLDLTRELSIEASFNQHQRGRYARIIEKSDWTWGLWIDDRGYVDFFFKTTDGAWHHNITMTEVPLRRWVHVRAEFDGLEAAVHLDGEEAVRNEMGPGQDELLVSDGDLYIGNRHLNDRGFVGVIDEVRVSNRVRSERPPLVMKISPFHSLGSWKVRANVRGMDQPVTRLTGAVRAADAQEALYTFSIDELDRGLGVADIPVGQPAPGAYTVSVVAEGADGREIAKQEAQVIVPDATPWLEAKAGVTDEVLPPWTPVSVHEGADVATVECWGRKYELRAGGLPAQVTTAGQGILAGEAVVTLDAGEISWQSPEVLESTDSRVVLGSSGEGARCGLKMRTQVEFDGMVRYDLDIEPPEGGVELQELLLEIPLVAARATLMHHPMGRWFEDQTCAGATSTPCSAVTSA